MGSIEVICGSMFSGKTKELIRRIKELSNTNLNYKVFKPDVDKRNEEDKIKSHNDISIDAISIKNADEIINYSSNCNVIAIDEAQFFSEDIIEVCNTLANKGMRIIVAGLDMDYLGKPFGPMPKLMAIAEDVVKVHAICNETGKPANYSFRKSNNDNTVMLGEKNEYEPLSREAFVSKMKKKKN